MTTPTSCPRGSGDGRLRSSCWQLVLIGLITAVTVTAGAMGWVALERRLIAASGDTIATMATAVATTIDLFLDERSRQVRTMAVLAASSPPKPDLLEVFRRMYPSYLWIGLADSRGRISIATDPATIGQKVSQTGWFREVEGQSGYFGEGPRGTLTIAARMDLESSNSPVGSGVLSAHLDLRAVDALIADTVRTFQHRAGQFLGVAYHIVREDGSVLIDSDQQQEGRLSLTETGSPSLRLALSGKPGFVEEPTLPGRPPMLTGYARTGAREAGAGPVWAVLLRVDRAEVLAPIRLLLRTVAALAGLLAGALLGLLVLATRRTRRQSMEAEAERSRSRRNERRLETILEVDPEGVLVLGPDRRILQLNPAARSLFDVAFPEEVLGQDVMGFLHPDDRAGFERVHAAALRGRSVMATARLIGLSGHIRQIEMVSALLPDDGSNGPSVLGVIRDVTERRLSDRRHALQYAVGKVLAESNSVEQALPDLLRAIATALEWPVGLFWLVHENDRAVRCVQEWTQTPAAIMEFLRASRRASFLSGAGLPGRCWARGEPLWIADVVKDPEFVRGPAAGSALHAGCAFPIWLRASVYGVMEFYSHEDHPIEPDLLRTFSIIGKQIGLFIERTEVEAALRDNESRTRLIIDTALDAVITMDSAGAITEWNAQAERMFGWAQHEAIGRDLADTIIPPGSRRAHREGLARYVATGQASLLNTLI